MSDIARKPLTDHELLLRMLCMSEHEFQLDRARIELEPAKFFWRAVCLQANATEKVDVWDWAEAQTDRYGVTP